MISRQPGFRPLSKCFNPLLFPRYFAVIISSRRVRSTLSTIPSTRNVSSNAPNTPGVGIESNTVPNPGLSNINPKSLLLGTKLISQSGVQYRVDRMLQHRTDRVWACVYLATWERPKILQFICADCLYITVIRTKRDMSSRTSFTLSLSTS